MKRTLHRAEKGRIIAGVCQGLGEYLGVDPLIVRIAFVLMASLNGAGLPLYLLAWLFIPKEEVAYATQEEMVRRNAEEIGQRARELGMQARSTLGGRSTMDPWDTAERPHNGLLIGGIVLVSVGALMLMNRLGALGWFNLARMLPVALIATGALLLLNNLRKG
ncbi:MAG: PspC domain-containing protein [Chloroflexi bacterium]|jgi:phage shock protein C|nr:PspC domain-containing protein [Chloroflexota bacterium]